MRSSSCRLTLISPSQVRQADAAPIARHWLVRVWMLVALSVIAGLVTIPSVSSQERRPNVLLVVADDLGPHLGSYGDKTVPTPNLDRLARKGVRFENAFVTQASCGPSRSTIYTGLYPHQNGQLGLANAGYAMDEGLPTIPALAKKAGYRTGVIGKVHVSPSEALPFDFEIRRSNTFDPHNAKHYVKAMRSFLAGTGDQPFFLVLSLGDPHRPFARRVGDLPKKPVGQRNVRPFPVHAELDTYRVRKDVAGYYNGVQRNDATMGLVRRSLRESGHSDNTLTIFLSDHGPAFARGKITTYEFGLRIPLIVHWPGRIVAGQMRSELVSTVDLAPTVLQAMGVPLPTKLPGRSLVPILLDQTIPWRKHVFAEFHAHGVRHFSPQRTIRGKRYKLVHNLCPGKGKPGLSVDGDSIRPELKRLRWRRSDVYKAFEAIRKAPPIELYDLGNDPIEYINLADDPAYVGLRDLLMRRLDTWRKRTHDPYLDSEASWCR